MLQFNIDVAFLLTWLGLGYSLNKLDQKLTEIISLLKDRKTSGQ